MSRSRSKVETGVDGLVDRALNHSRLFGKSYLDCGANCTFKEVPQAVHLSLIEARNLPLDRHGVEVARHSR